MRTILQGWHVIRILRLVLGVGILVQGIIAKDAITILLGAIFGGMAIANVGCCGANGCEVKTTASDKTKKIQYEELDTKK